MATDFDTLTSAIDDLTGDYQIDVAHSRLGFVARHAMVTKVRGTFKDFEGHAHLNAADPAKSTSELTIQVASIDTGQEQRDAHLRGPDFFDVQSYPTMTFTSTSAERVDDDTYRVTGDLTIKDVTKPVTIEFLHTGTAKDPYGNLRAGFEGQATINRKEWGLNWNAALETGGFLVSDRVLLELDVSAIKITPTA
jgi:polyisoprenoid-binding protein YceI